MMANSEGSKAWGCGRIMAWSDCRNVDSWDSVPHSKIYPYKLLADYIFADLLDCAVLRGDGCSEISCMFQDSESGHFRISLLLCNLSQLTRRDLRRRVQEGVRRGQAARPWPG